MAWGTIGAQFYSFNGTSKGTINAVFSASGSQQRSRVGRCSVLLPRILTPTQAGYIVDGGICRVYATYNGTQKDICTFVISSRNTVYRSPNHYLEIGGYGQLHELSFRNADGILSAYFTGTVAAATATTITFDSAVGSTDLTGWIAKVTVGATAPQGVIIESYNIATKTATIKYAWPNGTPAASDTYIVYGGATATDDLDQFASTWLAAAGWTLEAEGGATGTADGTLLYFVGDTVLGALVDISDASGEWFRVKSFTPNDRTIEWRTTADSSGVTLSTTANTHGVILNLSEDYDYNIVTRVYPGGAGLSSNQLNLNGATYTLPAGFAYVTDPTYGIANTALEGGGGDGVAYVSEYPNWAHIQPVSESNEALLAAKNQLAKQSVQYLQARSGARKFYRVRAEMITDVKPGQTIGISYTAPGFTPYTISESALYIQEVNYSIGGAAGENRRIADLVLTETLLPRPDSADDVARSFKVQKDVIKRGGAGGAGGAGGTGGGGLPGGYVTLDANAAAILTLTNTTATLQTIGLESQTANQFIAAPNGSDGVPTFRALVENDLPSLTPSFLTLATSTRLTNERVLTAGTGIGFVDTGANGTLTVSINESSFTTPGTLSVSSTNASGPPHTHAITSSSDTSGGGSSLLKSDSNGDLKVRRMDVGDYFMIDGNRILSNELTNNLFIGTNSGNASATTPSATTARTTSLGASALKDATAAVAVVAIGTSAMQSTVSASDTVAIGECSLLAFNSVNAVAVGVQAGRNSTSGQESVHIGAYAGYSNQTGIGLVHVGSRAGYGNVAGNFNVHVGYGSGQNHTSGSNNVWVGTNGGWSNTTGSGNIFVGHGAGYWETGSNKLYIDNSSSTNPLIYGELPNTTARLAALTVELGDGTNSTTLKTRAADLKLDVAGGDFLLKSTTDISGESWTSGFLGNQWGIDTGLGHADFRSIYADELRVTHFIAEAALTKVGSLWITKSQGTLTRGITLGSVGAGATLYVEDAPGVPNTAVFSSGDYVLLRKFRTSGDSLVVANAWGQVTNYSDLSGGEQSWTFTLRGGDAAGETIDSGSLALDFGKSGDGYITMTTLDNAGSPYAQIATWRGNPYTASNRTVHTRWGNLDGLAGIDREFGLYAGLSPTSARIVATDTRVALHSVPLSMYSGGDNQIIILFSLKLATNLQSDRRANGDISQSNVNTTAGNYYSVLNDSTSSYLYNSFNSSNAEAWFDLESITTGMSYLDVSSEAQAGATDDGIVVTAQLFKSDGTTELTDEIMLANQDDTATNQQVLTKRFGYVDSAASQTDWNGARLRLRWYYYPSSGESEVIRLDPFVPSIAVGDPLPTAVNVGDGIWMGRHDATGTYRFRVGHATGPKLLWNASSLALYDSGGNVAIDFAASGNAKISGTLNLGTSGGIYQGTGTFASPTTGMKLWNDGGIGRIAGYNGGTLQAGFNTSGKLTAGGGVVTLDASGIVIEASTSYSDTRAYQLKDSSGNITGTLGGQVPSPAISSNTLLTTKGITGRSSSLQLFSEALSTNSSSVHISAYNGSADAGILITTTNVLIENCGLSLKVLSSTASGNDVIYRKGTKLIVKYLDGATTRYKYLQLAGTGVAWVHTTTAP